MGEKLSDMKDDMRALITSSISSIPAATAPPPFAAPQPRMPNQHPAATPVPAAPATAAPVPAPAPTPSTSNPPASASAPAPATTARPPVPPPPTQTATSSPTNALIAALHQLSKTEHKLQLESFSKKTREAYAAWKFTTLTTMRAHPRFKTYVQFSLQRGLHLLPNMVPDDNSYLFTALTKAISKSILLDIGINEYVPTEGLLIFRRLEQEYGLVVNTRMEKLTLVTKLTTLRKDPREELVNYHHRFRHAVSACQANGVLPYTTNTELFALYLQNTNEQAFKTVLFQLENGDPSVASWIACPDLEALRIKAKTYLRNYNNAYSPSERSNKDSPTSTTRTSIEDRASHLSKYVSRNDDSAVINHLRQQIKHRKNGCSLHDRDTHKYSDCARVKEILEKHGKLPCLEKALSPGKPSPKEPKAKRAKSSKSGKPKADPDIEKMKRRLARKTKECDDLMRVLRASTAALPPPLGSTASANQFSALNESHSDDDESEVEYDSSDDSDSDGDDNHSVNSSNASSTSYSSSRSSSPPFASCHRTSSSPSYPNQTVIDSGCTHHMDNQRQDFIYITPFTSDDGSIPHVTLGDDSTLPIHGLGPVRKTLSSGHTIQYISYFVPGLSSSLYSVHQHSKSQGCYFHSENQSAVLAFPTFVETLSTSPEITFRYAHPSSRHAQVSFNSESHPPSSTATTIHAKIVQPSYLHPDFTPSQLNQFTSDFRISVPATIDSTHLRPSTSNPTYDQLIPTPLNITIAPSQTISLPTGLIFSPPKNHHIHINGTHTPSFETSSQRLSHSSIPSSLTLLVSNPTPHTITIPKGTIVATYSISDGSLAKVRAILPSHPSKPPKQSTSTSSPSSKRFQVFHTRNGSILIDHNRRSQARARRMNRPLSSGVRHPQPPHPIPDNLQWTSHHLSDDEALDESPILQQSCPSDKIPSPPSTTPTPTPMASERVGTTTPKHVRITPDHLRQSIGYLKTDSLLRNLDILGTGSLSVSGLSSNPKVDPGTTASINSSRRNTKPSSPPKHYSDTWHMDIGYGPCTAHGGVKYTLLFVDKATRYKRIYPLKNLKSSLLRAVKLFFKDCKVTPKLIRTDFDKKLLHGDVAAFIEETKEVSLEAAPPKRQHQNGLVERAWQTAVSMTRNWLTSSLLPSKYWWFGMKRAIEVMNILPTSHIKHKRITPHELVYGTKVDYRTLFPMFSVAYLKQEREQGGSHKNKWRSRTLKCILVGTDPKSDGLLFFHPPSKQLLSGNDGYRLDTFLPSGPQFSLSFDGAFVFNTRHDMDCIHRPLAHDDNDTVFYKDPDTDQYTACKILSSPLDDEEEPYTVQVIETGSIHEYMATDLHDSDPTAPPTDSPDPSDPFPLFPWLKPDAKITLFLSSMSKPKQGFLRQSDDQSWSFSPGRTGNKPSQPLHNFDELASHLISNKKLFQGWKSHKSVLTARHIRATSNILARHVSAATLKIQEAPSLLQHHLLHPHDRKLWDAAYQEEIQGLLNLKTWEVISEDEYKRLRSVTGKALPTMAISKIKKDEHGNPQRCKYRIVVLGNLDNHAWDKSDCFAPVLSQPEMRLLVSIAAGMKRIPKCGDVSQAFCQGVLPPNEQYVIRPPPGCPVTPTNSYWRLIRTLYGLKRSPRHWYDKARKILTSIGLKPVRNSSCIFHGTVIKGHPPIYIGLYVDDFIYFSASDLVEKEFEKQFGSHVKTTFDGDVTHFLGIAFHSTRHPDGHVSIHLSQEAFIDTLLQRTRLDTPDSASAAPSPYRSGLPIDKLPSVSYDAATQHRLNHKLQQLTGSLQWLSTSTRPDISTVTSLLAQYNHKATKGHLDAAKRVVRYLKGTKQLGIAFHSRRNTTLQSFVKFPIAPNTVTPFTDANWGPQDQSKPKPTDPPLKLFKSRSISGFLLWINGPVHWSSRRQSITARSTAEAEIYATDECVKFLQFYYNILEELSLHTHIMKRPTIIYNDNAACVRWSHSLSTKGLRYIQIRENAVREQVQLKHVSIRHIEGALNLSDIFTKEDKDTPHFIQIRNFILEPVHHSFSTQMFSPSSNFSTPQAPHQSIHVEGGIKSGSVRPSSDPPPPHPSSLDPSES